MAQNNWRNITNIEGETIELEVNEQAIITGNVNRLTTNIGVIA
jgi:hypothetical protein